MTGRPTITEPGVYELDAEDYHADPVPGGSLSSSGARRILPPGCPALFRYEQDNPPPPRKALDLGTAAHREVLGIGPDLVVVPGARWDTKAAKAQVAEARAGGAVPLKEHEFAQVQEMATALREHPVASRLFAPDSGRPEQTLVWRDEPTGVWRRARLDWLRTTPGRLIVPDYKTCVSAEPGAIQRAVQAHGYHQQAAWYLSGVQALTGREAAFLLVCQEKTPPYLVTVAELYPLALSIGRGLNRQALELYKACRDSGHWPGYSDEIEQISLPAWVENRYLEGVSA